MSPLRIIVTYFCPSNRSEAGEDTTCTCAKRTGIGDNVPMISEPEVAGIHSLDVMNPDMLEKGDTFVVVDAGGG